MKFEQKHYSSYDKIFHIHLRLDKQRPPKIIRSGKETCFMTGTATEDTEIRVMTQFRFND